MKVKTIAQLHILSVILVGMFMTYDTPIITGYITWSFFLWVFGYPIYHTFGKPGWDDY